MFHSGVNPLYKNRFRRYSYLFRLLPPRPNFDFDNVFVIGMNKTGTTSVNLFLKSLGLRHLTINEHVKQQWSLQRHSYLMWLTKRFNSFDDVPWNRPDVIERLMQIDQDSRFILTLRDSDEWFSSLQRFRAKRGRPVPSDDEAEHIKNTLLLAHNENCRALAQRYDRKLLEVDVTKDSQVAVKIAAFLGLDTSQLPEFPHANRTN
ncbi:sulfotransferase [Ruegeria arenilitoris]|uniref:sulfotransferase n=1 Tax=Ruegeria arenilitoris TaxID=1173585 RepID=UPI00147C7743|nr:sulfotransferase [Ruegeria arenilitoris]